MDEGAWLARRAGATHIWLHEGMEILLGGGDLGTRRREVEPTLVIEVRHPELLAAAREEQEDADALQSTLDDPGRSERHRRIDARIAAQLRDLMPGYPALVGHALIDSVYEGVMRLIERTAGALPDRSAHLQLATDRLSDRLAELLSEKWGQWWEMEGQGSSEARRAREEWEARRRRLGKAGLTFTLHPGAEWNYNHDVLWRIWRADSASAVGEDAFVLLQEQGWETGFACGRGSDQFREVIQRGEAFLRDRPHSAYRRDTLLALAQAYETWWSLSQAAEDHPYVEPLVYAKGAAEAHARAVELYEQVLQETPESGILPRYIRRHLHRLRLGVDTNQRRFLCIWD